MTLEERIKIAGMVASAYVDETQELLDEKPDEAERMYLEGCRQTYLWMVRVLKAALETEEEENA
jgi:hypothetical protein